MTGRVSCNGSEWSGLLPPGILTTALVQALFGTKAGPAILLILLAL